MRIKTVWMLVIVALSAFLSSGCQTIQGLGKDIQSGGKALEQVTK